MDVICTNYLSMLGLKLIHVTKRGPRRLESITWWRHQMETFSASLTLCAGNSPGTSEFPAQRPVTGSFDVFFDLRLKKPLSKQSRGWWFDTPLRSLWRHCNVPFYMKNVGSWQISMGTSLRCLNLFGAFCRVMCPGVHFMYAPSHWDTTPQCICRLQLNERMHRMIPGAHSATCTGGILV